MPHIMAKLTRVTSLEMPKVRLMDVSNSSLLMSTFCLGCLGAGASLAYDGYEVAAVYGGAYGGIEFGGFNGAVVVVPAGEVDVAGYAGAAVAWVGA